MRVSTAKASELAAPAARNNRTVRRRAVELCMNWFGGPRRPSLVDVDFERVATGNDAIEGDRRFFVCALGRTHKVMVSGPSALHDVEYRCRQTREHLFVRVNGRLRFNQRNV